MPEYRHKCDNYEDFVKKFEAKKTTDDCYTPPAVYNEVLQLFHALTKGQYRGARIIRPFYPGGDYKTEDYTGDCVVIDNPPFSIYCEIVKWYEAHNVKYFLFGPGLCLFQKYSCGFVVLHDSIVYDNGANVSTGFASNCFEGIYGWRSVDHRENKTKKKHKYPDGYETSATMRKYITDDKLHYWTFDKNKWDRNGYGLAYGVNQLC